MVGNLFNAIEMAKLGVSFEDKGFKKKLIGFDAEKKEIAVSIPTKSLIFVEEEGFLKAEFDFEFHI